MALFWLFFAITMVAIEVVTTAFFAIFIAIGGVAAMAYAFTSDNVWWQIAIFAIVSLGGAVIARPTLVRLFESKTPTPRLPGAQQLVGQTAIATDEIGDEHHTGHVRIGGESWLAVGDGATPIAKDTEVLIVAVRGTTLLVSIREPDTATPPSVQPTEVQ